MRCLSRSPVSSYLLTSVSRYCALFSCALDRICLSSFCALRSAVWHSFLFRGSGNSLVLFIRDVVLMIALVWFVLCVNWRRISFNRLTWRLASLSSGDHGGRLLEAVLRSALRSAFVTSLSISLIDSRSWRFEWFELAIWLILSSMLYSFQYLTKCSRNFFVWLLFVDWSPREVAGIRLCCLPNSVLWLKSTMIPRWSECVCAWNGSYVESKIWGSRDREHRP